MRRAGRPWRPSPRPLPRLLPWPEPAAERRRSACCRPCCGDARSAAAAGGRLPGRARRGRPDGGPDRGAEGAAGRRLRARNQAPGAAGAVPAGPRRPGDGPGRRGRLCPDRQRTHRRGPPVRIPGPDDGAAADPGRPAGRDDLLAARPDHRGRNRGLDAAGAAALEAHFLDPGAPNPARGCPAGDLVPSRFRAKARAWRERHHPASIEERHTRSAADRRVEYAPDRDGMAWLSAHLPADTAAGIWDRTTAAARALQGPDEARTLAQLRADITATWLLTTGTGTGCGNGRRRHRRNGRRRHRRPAPAPARGRELVRGGLFRSRGRRSWSPSRSCPCSAPPTNRPSWTGTGRSRRRWPAA